jgi:hemolysin-activating ACP:hemolysin acyltransferase
MNRIEFSFKNESERKLAEQIGSVTYLDCLTCGSSIDPHKLRSRLLPPLRLQQIKIFYHQNRHFPIGYVTWAFLAPDVERRLLEDPTSELHLSEWNEGTDVWIMDLVAPGYCIEIIHHIKQQMFLEHNAVHWLPRRDRSAGKSRAWLRDKRAGFCRVGDEAALVGETVASKRFTICI